MMGIQKVKKKYDYKLKDEDKKDDILNFDKEKFILSCNNKKEEISHSSDETDAQPIPIPEKRKRRPCEYQLFTNEKSTFLKSISNPKDYLKLKLERDKFQTKLTKDDM